MSSSQQKPNNANAQPDLDEVIRTNIVDLERLANFYHSRGDYQKAHEIWMSLRTMKSQIRNRMKARLTDDGSAEAS